MQLHNERLWRSKFSYFYVNMLGNRIKMENVTKVLLHELVECLKLFL